MSRQNLKPPALTDEISYEDWKNDVEIWSDVTDLDATKQGGAVFLSLTGKAQATVRAGVTRDDMKSSTGLTKIIAALDALFKKDATRSALSTYEHFIKFRRNPDMSIEDFLVEFNIRYSKVKTLKMGLPDGVLAYYLLECANLTDEQQNICRATCDTLKFESMKEKILRVTTDKKTKYENQFYGHEHHTYHDEAAYAYPQQYPEPQYEYQNAQEYQTDHPAEEENNEHSQAESCNNDVYFAPAQGGKTTPYRHPNSYPRYNRPDEFGNPSRCGFCKSIFHHIADCPDHKMTQKTNFNPYNARRGNASFRGGFSRGPQRGGFNARPSYPPSHRI